MPDTAVTTSDASGLSASATPSAAVPAEERPEPTFDPALWRDVRAQSITPRPTPHGAISAIRALMDNPIKIWPEPLYHRSHLVTGRRSRFIHIADPALAQGVLLDNADRFHRSRLGSRLLKPALRDGLLTVEGETWRRQRRIAAPAFRVQAIRALAPVMVEAGARAAARLAAEPGVRDVALDMTQATYEVVLDTLLHLDRASPDAAAMSESMAIYIESMGKVDLFDAFDLPLWLPRPWKRRGARAARRIREAAANAVSTSVAAAGPSRAETRRSLTDLLTAAADPETGGGLSQEELVDNVVTFIGAGHETTALALTWSLYLIAQSPALQDALASEAEAAAAASAEDGATADAVDRLALHLAVIEEALRLYPPAALIARNAQADVRVEGADGPVEIRAGDEVAIATYVLHRHRRLWDEPDAFRPGRTPAHRFAYLPFGAGPRVCIGVKFALLEAAAILGEITRRVRFAPGPERTVEPVMRITLRPKGGMPLQVRPRCSVMGFDAVKTHHAGI